MGRRPRGLGFGLIAQAWNRLQTCRIRHSRWGGRRFDDVIGMGSNMHGNDSRSYVPKAIVISLLAVCAMAQGQPISMVGRIEHEAIRESSGIIASRQHEGVFWTHNDSGHRAVLFALDREGRHIAEFPVAGQNLDWEDIAIDEHNRLYIGDIGNNLRRREEIVVYRLFEPDPHSERPADAPPLAPETRWRLRYPAEAFDAEALFIHDGHGYIISKVLGEAGLYRFELRVRTDPVTLERVATLPVRFPVTAADLSRDAGRLAVLTVGGLYVFPIDGDPGAAAHTTPRYVRYLHPLIEAATFVEEGVLVTAESREIFLFRLEEPE